MEKKPKKRSTSGPRIKGRETNSEVDDSDQKSPVFSFEYLQQGWCVQDCQQEERSRMLDKLRRLSQLSWKQIRQEHRHGLGTEIIRKNSLKVEVPGFITDDVRLLAFRAFDMVAMVGYRNGRIFHIIWIDRTFTLYDHG